MTQRTIPVGANPTIIIKAGSNVTVRGQESEFINAETSGSRGLTIDKHSAAEFARARAAVGEHVLFDLRLKRPGRRDAASAQDVIEVQIWASGQVNVPRGASLKVYAGNDIEIQDIQGSVDAYSGGKIQMQAVGALGTASSGGAMNLECQSLVHPKAEFKAGGDLRLFVRDLNSARVRVSDLGGYWEALIGDGEKRVTLKCGGDVTLVTDEQVLAQPPQYILGKIEKASPS